MKRPISSLLALVFVFSIALRIAAAEVQPGGTVPKANEPAFYPWSETSDYVRVPKSFLGQVTIFSVTMTNTETRQFVLRDEFVNTFKFTPPEVERIAASLTDALHQYRMEEGKHLEPTNEDVNAGPPQRRGPAAVEMFSFRLAPFPEEARAIRRKLEASVLETLGEERSKFFWQSPSILESEMRTFTQESPVPAGMVRSTTFTYQLTDANSGPLIDLYKSTMTRPVEGRRGGGGGSSGGTYGAPLDQYAPEAMKPVLARWRKAIADGTVRSKAAASPDTALAVEPNGRVSPSINRAKETEAAKSSPRQTEPAPLSAPTWDDKAPFVDLPKSLIKSLQFPGLTEDGEISPEAGTLFGLTPSEGQAIRALYDEMKTRFEQLERANFGRTEPGKNSFVLRAFPEKSVALQHEWVEKLKELAGKNRGELLDHSIRTRFGPFRHMRRGDRPLGGRFPGDTGPDWLHRGAAEMQIDISPGPMGRDGQPTLRIEYRTQGGGGESGSWGGRPDQVPERWRHLLTPDILGVPLKL